MKQHYIKALALFFLLSALGACSKDKTTTPNIDFGGYTGRDAKGQLISPFDPTDWTTDATWNSSEQALFASEDLLYDAPMVPASVWKITLYPNPVGLGSQSQFAMSLDETNPAVPNALGGLSFLYKVVDARYNVLEWGMMYGVDTSFANTFDYPASKYSANTLYRIYYVVCDSHNKRVFYKGHGDIKVIP